MCDVIKQTAQWGLNWVVFKQSHYQCSSSHICASITSTDPPSQSIPKQPTQPEGPYTQAKVCGQSCVNSTLTTCLLTSLTDYIIHCILQVRVSIPAPKLSKKLPVGTKLTTPAPQVLAGTYRKALGAAAPAADTAAAIIASAMNNRSV